MMEADDQKHDVPLHAGGLMSSGRLEAFSDGVFAIVISLLILNIRVPSASSTAGSGLLSAIVNQWPAWVSFVVSFLLVGMGWINHHQLFRQIRQIDVPLLVLNIVLLMFMTVFPFTTALLAEYVRDADGQQVAAIFYAAILALISLTYLLIWMYAVRRQLVAGHVSRQMIRRATRRRLIGTLAYVMATGLGFVNAPLSIAVSFAVAGFYFLTSSGPKSRQSNPG